MKTGILCASLASVLLTPAAPALGDSDFRAHPMRFEHLTLDEGLSQSNVLSILQDSRGQMWFGTENGLNSFNGYEFRTYYRERGNADSLSSDFIFDVAEDASGNLWIATNGGGLAYRDSRSGVFSSYRHDAENDSSIRSNIVRRVLVDRDGSVWAGTRNGGLSRLDVATGNFSHFRFASEAGPDDIYSLLQDSNGTIWAGGDHGLSRIDESSGETRTFAVSSHGVRAVYEDSNGQIWAGTFGGGLHRFDTETESFTKFVNDPENGKSISGNKVTAIFEDRDGRFWVGTTNGLNLLDRSSGNFIRYSRDDSNVSSLADNSITAIYEDRGGVLWVGTKTHGISKWNSRTWAYGFESGSEITTKPDTKPVVTSFVEDLNGSLWVGTFGEGVNAINRQTGEVSHYRHHAADTGSISDDRVMSMMRDQRGNIWIGTMTRGIDLLNPATGEIENFRFNADDPTSLSANGIMTLYEDSTGQVWVGTFGGGISLFDEASRTFKRFSHDPETAGSLSSDRVTSFVEGPSGRMWVGTEAGGLNLFDAESGEFTQFRHDANDPNTLADDTVYSLTTDNNGTVWVGTRGGGLNRVVGDATRPGSISFENISVADGLANDVIYGIKVDAAGLLWMSTNYGISRFNPDTGEFSNLHRSDGLQSEEFNFGAHYRSDSGELFFGGNNGYNAFSPEKLQLSAAVPAIMLTAFHNMSDPTKSGLPEDESEGIDLDYRDDNVAFEFAAMDFAAPSMNQFAYKLEGFDNDWIMLGNERRISYTDLDAGNYLLRVKAANSAGVWNDTGFAMPVRVAAAPWATWWAYLAYVAMALQAAAFLWIAHKRKIQREEEYSHRLEQEVELRTKQLTDRNKQLKVLNQALQESSLSDPLTGLRNRRFVFEEVSRDLEVVRRRIEEEQQGIDQTDAADLIFMMIDLDNFKPINDTYGHAAGDEMLLQVRDALLSTCRRSDFVIRWGGDEFLVIAKQTRPEESEALAERIRKTIAEANFILNDGQIVRTTCSIGFAAYPLFRAQLDESGLDQIICLADGLMYEAKKKRDAWAGMFTPTEACTSFIVEDGELEPTSLLFRAKRAGKLLTYYSDAEEASARKSASRQN
ncbi:MAG: two-component regulator propeller domain-containing protein [Woeseiaceae bacterium]